MEKELKTVQKIYAAMAAMLALSLVPSIWAAVLVVILFTAILYVAGSIRKKSAPDGLTANHMTWIIRTIWLSSLLAGVTGIFASIYVLGNYDPSPVFDCADGFSEGDFDIESCVNNFIDTNYAVFRNGTLMAGVPAGLYFLIRFIRGLILALKGRMMAKPRTWL